MSTSDIIAIDILLEPDARMLVQAESNNARLRETFPDGFALDAEHRPHITLLQCFIAANDLEALCDAAGDVIQSANVTSMELQAVRFGYNAANSCGTATPGHRTPECVPRRTIDNIVPIREHRHPVRANLVTRVGSHQAVTTGDNSTHASCAVAPGRGTCIRDRSIIPAWASHHVIAV